MKALEQLLARFPTLKFDHEEYEESLAYRDFLNSADAAGLAHAIEEHGLYRRYHDLQVVDRRAISSTENAFNPMMSSSETHWRNCTSGTSGAPLELFYSSRFYFYHLFETIPRILRQAGLSVRSAKPHLHVYLTDNRAHEFCAHVDPREDGTISVTVPVHCGDDEDWQQAYTIISELQPHTLASKPNMFRLWLERSEGPPLKRLSALISSGSQLSPTLASKIERKFNAPVLNAYITSEAGLLGVSCSHGKMHLQGPHVHFGIRAEDESLKDSGRGDLLITSYLNDCMPLRNYAIGDQVELQLNGCACGQTGAFLNEFSGRSVPMFHLPSGKSFSPTRWMKILTHFPEIREFQITHLRNGDLDVRVEAKIPLESFAAHLKTFLLEGLEEELSVCLQPTVFPPDAKLQRFRRETE